MSSDERNFAKGSGMAGNGRSDGEEGPHGPGAEVNSRTRIAMAGGVFDRSALAWQAAFARYESSLRAAAHAYPPDHVFVASLDSDSSPARIRVLAPGESLILGRHTNADLVHDAGDLSLRQLAVVVAPDSTADETLVRLWDLATGHAFITEDGCATEAVTADGPVFARVGSLHLAVIPLSSLPRELPIGSMALWTALPRREFVSRIAEGSAMVRMNALATAESAVRGGRALGSQILGSQILGGQAGAAPRRKTDSRITRVRPAAPPLDCEPDIAVATLTVQSGAERRTFRVSAEALERGILLGRYERCLPLRDVSSNVSRVHLLIAQVGSQVMAIDTASSNGSYHRSHGAFEALVLSDSAELSLAEHMLVGWKPLTVGRA